MNPPTPPSIHGVWINPPVSGYTGDVAALLLAGGHVLGTVRCGVSGCTAPDLATSLFLGVNLGLSCSVKKPLGIWQPGALYDTADGSWKESYYYYY